jgi:nucleoside-diphosphate-sugar epimerase
MRIAILGATSQIARDLTQGLGALNEHKLNLYARRPDIVRNCMKFQPTANFTACAFEDFESLNDKFDAIINFVGCGNPARVSKLGTSILETTHEFDSLALNYLKRNVSCRYIFLSSGAVYGGGFETPADDQKYAVHPINQLGMQDWYGMAKVFAETRHRALAELPIVDLRVFNYFSQSTDIEARYLISDILRSIRNGEVLHTSQENLVRDYIGPKDFLQLILKVLMAPPQNVAIDCFTRAPVDKISLLECMKNEFGLSYQFVEQRTGLFATGGKLNYFSKSRKATDLFGYTPEETSIDLVVDQSRLLLSRLCESSINTVQGSIFPR